MKIKIQTIEPTEYTDNEGNAKYRVLDANGQTHTTVDKRLLRLEGKIVDVKQRSGVFKGKEWSKIELSEQEELEKPEKAVFNPEYLEKKNELNARQTALNAAVTEAAARIEKGEEITGKQILDKAEVNLKWLKGGKVNGEQAVSATEPKEEEAKKAEADEILAKENKVRELAEKVVKDMEIDLDKVPF